MREKLAWLLRRMANRVDPTPPIGTAPTMRFNARTAGYKDGESVPTLRF